MRAYSLIAAVTLAAGCASTVTPPPREPDPERARAALATLIVQNETTQPLAILYRTVGTPGAGIGIGRVAATDTMEMAPVPAGEPLLLIARTDDGRENVLPPRTLAIDGTWTWRIVRNTRFVRPPSDR